MFPLSKHLAHAVHRRESPTMANPRRRGDAKPWTSYPDGGRQATERIIEMRHSRAFCAAVLDLAIIRAEGVGADCEKHKLTDLKFTASDLMVGETIIAIGSPYGYDATVSRGIISAVDREITMPNDVLMTGLIQHDAAINP